MDPDPAGQKSTDPTGSSSLTESFYSVRHIKSNGNWQTEYNMVIILDGSSEIGAHKKQSLAFDLFKAFDYMSSKK